MPDYPLTVDYNQPLVQTFIGWAFTGAPCIPYDATSTGQNSFVFNAGKYSALMSQYNFNGIISPSLSLWPPNTAAASLWSVSVGSTKTLTIPATTPPGTTTIMNCICPDCKRQISNGQCQGLCPNGQYIAQLTDTVCSPCPQGSYFENSIILPCPPGNSSLAGASECTPCVSPGGATNIQLYTCGLKTCTPKK